MLLEDLHTRMTTSREKYRKALTVHRAATEDARLLGDHPEATQMLREANQDLERATHLYMADLTAYTAYLIREK